SEPRSLESCTVGHSPSRRAVAIDAVGPRAEHSNVLAAANLHRARQRELLVASAHAAVRDLHRHLASRDQAHAAKLFLEFAEPGQQGFRRPLKIPVITRAVDVRLKTCT